jgi:hypothetical protein
LRILETKGDREDIQAVQEQLRTTDEAAKETLAMLYALKELIGRISSGCRDDFESSYHDE